MMPKKTIRLMILLCNCICCSQLLQAQQTEMDSLSIVLEKFRTSANYETDTNFINTLNLFAFKYNQIKPDTTILLSRQSLDLSNKIDYLKGKADALKNMGLGYNVKGEYNQSLTFLAEALSLWKKAGNLKGMGIVYYATGIIFSNLGNYPEALENYFQALKIREELGDKHGISSSINAIGAIYFVQGKFNDALTHYLKSLKLSREVNNQTGVESAYANIGEVYFRQAKYEAAQESLFKALKLNEKSGNRENRAFISLMLGSIKFKQGNYSEAMEYYHKTKALAIEIGSKEYTSRSNLGLGEVSLALKDYDKSLKHTQDGVSIARQIGYIELLRDGNEILTRIYETKGMATQALFHHKQFKLYADSINNQQTEQRTQNLAADYEYNKKEIVLKAEQEKKEIEFQKKTNQQRWIIFSAFAALFSALVVALLIYRSRQKEKKSNLLLHRKNEEIDKQKNIAEKSLAELKTTQALLIQSEKMASLGELTAGIAHEIQNPLNFVNNFSEVSNELISEMVEEVDKGNTAEIKLIAKDVQQNLEKILHHGKRADAIVKGMLQHSSSGSGKKEPTDINKLADEYLRLAYHGLRAKDKSFNATMKTEFDEGIGNINIIPQDIGRVILNLITNAFYVTNEKQKQGLESYEPTVTVKTLKNPPSGSQAERREGTQFGGAVVISVTDNGNGIPQKILDKIFQPFFTTKPTGQGTGLGLSLSYDIVKAHGGELKVETKEGEGSKFIIVLPFIQ